MAGKWSRTVVGNIVKSKDPTKASYVKVNLFKQSELLLKNGDYLQLQTNKFRKDSLDADLAAGKLDEAKYEQLVGQIERQPEFVLGNLVLVKANE